MFVLPVYQSRHNINNANLFQGEVRFLTGGKVRERRIYFKADSVKFRNRRYSPDERNKVHGNVRSPKPQTFKKPEDDLFGLFYRQIANICLMEVI